MATTTDSLVSSFNITELTGSSISNALIESFNVMDATSSAKLGVLVEAFTVSDVASPTGTFQGTLTSALVIKDSMSSYVGALMVETFDFTETMVADQYSRVSSSFDFSSQASTSTTVTDALVSTFNVSSQIRAGQFVAVVDSFNVADATRSFIRASLVEAFDFADVADHTSVRGGSLSSSFNIMDVLASSISATLKSVSRFSFSDYAYAIDDEAPAFWTNSQGMAASLWRAVPYESFVMHNGELLALGDDGIYLINGDGAETDPIAASVKGDLTDLDNEFIKCFECALVGAKTSGPLRVTVQTEQGTYSYDTHLPASTFPTTHRAPIGRGLTGRYVRVSLDNLATGSEGASMQVNDVKLRVGNTARVG